MTFVVSELVKGAWIVRGATPSYPEAQAIAKAIKTERLARGERPERVERSLEIRNHFSEQTSSAKIIVGAKDTERPPRPPRKPMSDGKVPLIFIGGTLVFFFGTKIIAEYDPKLAQIVFGMGLATFILSIIYLFFRGMKFREVMEVLKFLFCAIVALFVLSAIMPSSCSDTSSTNFDWVRKP